MVGQECVSAATGGVCPPEASWVGFSVTDGNMEPTPPPHTTQSCNFANQELKLGYSASRGLRKGEDPSRLQCSGMPGLLAGGNWVNKQSWGAIQICFLLFMVFG